MNRYELSPEAADDLLSIQEFVSADSPAAAERLIEEFFSAFEHLAAWPRSGHSRRDLTEKAVFFWPIGSYLVVYHIRDEDKLLQIVAVLPGSARRACDTREPVNTMCAENIANKPHAQVWKLWRATNNSHEGTFVRIT